MQRFKLAMLAAVLAFTTVRSVGQQQTNLVQDLDIQLSGLRQAGSVTNHGVVTTDVAAAQLGRADVVRALAAATGNTFSRTARLILITPLPSGSASVAVQDGDNRVDVTSFFLFEQDSDFLTSSTLSLRTGLGASSDYSLQRFALVDAFGYPALTVHFDVRGIQTSNVTTTANRAPRYDSEADVTGSGDKAGSLLLLQGTIRFQGSSFEVVASPPPGV